MTEIVDLSILEGGWSAEKPVVILDADTAHRALELGELDALVKQGLDALSLSGKHVVFLEQA